jgi:hypothetical protein
MRCASMLAELGSGRWEWCIQLEGLVFGLQSQKRYRCNAYRDAVARPPTAEVPRAGPSNAPRVASMSVSACRIG